MSKKVTSEEQKQIDEERQVLRKLVVDEREVIKGLADLVERAKSVFSIASPGGKIIFQDFGSLSDERRILVLLLGKYFALRLGFVETADLGISEIAEELGRSKTALSGDVGTLMKDGFVEKLPDRTYRIAYNCIRDIFNKILPDKNQAAQKIGLPGVPARGNAFAVSHLRLYDIGLSHRRSLSRSQPTETACEGKEEAPRKG